MVHNITIKDLARILDISTSTVSRALRDSHDIKSDTREKVLTLASQLRYKPNFNAVALAEGSTHNIGVILPFVTNYYFSTVITGMQQTAYSNGYNIILFLTNDLPERELSIVQNLTISSLDGLLVSVSSVSCGHFKQIIEDGTPIVFFDRVPDNIEATKVMQDDYNGAFQAVSHLIENGFRKIAHIAGPKGLNLTEKRLQGYYDALAKQDIPVNPDWVIFSGFSQQDGQMDTKRLLELKDKPDAVFAVNDRKAIGSMLELKAQKIIIGSEFGVVGFTGDPASTVISPSLSTIAEPAFEIGRTSCELLLKHITRKSYFHPKEVVLPGKLIVRESSKGKALS